MANNGASGIGNYLSYSELTPTSNTPSDSEETISNIGMNLSEQKNTMDSSTP